MTFSKNMTVRAVAAAALSLGTVALTGCSSSSGARRIEETQAVTTVGQIDIQDFNLAAKDLINKMLVSVPFSEEMARLKTTKPTGQKPLVLISRIKNDTTLKVDMRGFLVDPMEEVLLESGKVKFHAEDSASQSNAAAQELLSGGSPQLPDLVLYGTVRDLRTSAGDVKQATYVFHLRLAGTDGSTVWQGQRQIIKQGKRPSIGM